MNWANKNIDFEGIFAMPTSLETTKLELGSQIITNNITGERRSVASFRRVRIIHRGIGDDHVNSCACPCEPLVRPEDQ